MARWMLIVALAAMAALMAQEPQQQQAPDERGELKRDRKPPAKAEEYPAPPEEDEAIAPTEYSFNPLQSQKDLRVGDWYFKQKNYRAAAGRYREATRWNEQNADAWLKLGEASEKAKDPKAAREAYAKYLALAPESKKAAEVRKRVAKLK